MSTPIGENPNKLREAKADERRARMASDLDRLEALINRLERDRFAPRLPRAAHLPPVPGLSRAGERFDDDDRPPAWLKPEQLPISLAMMRRRERGSWGWFVGILVASVCVLSIAYYLVGGWQPRSATEPQLASIAEKAAVAQAPFAKSPRILAQDDGAEPLDANESPSRAGPPRAASPGHLAMVKPADPVIGALSPKPAVQILDAETIMLLIKQGEQLAEAGDVAAARTLFQRAAEAGDAAAATSLGATYDPTVLAGMRAVGIDSDMMKARFWYQKAISLGSTEAKRRLELLANQ